MQYLPPVLQGFSDRMYPFLYDSANGVQYDEVVREHQLPGSGLQIGGLSLPIPGMGGNGLPGILGNGIRLPAGPLASTATGASSNPVGIGMGALGIGAGSAQAVSNAPTTGQYDAAAESAAFIEAANRKVLFLVTPRLAAFAREYYGCPGLPGAPADALTEGSHWRQANINVSSWLH